MGITTIENRINGILDENKKIFIPYIMCGDGGFDKTKEVIRLLENSGASIIEIGIPFSDPIADGPVIQSAGQRALDNGTTLKKSLAFLKSIPPNNDVPRIIMTYLNPIIQYGFESFFSELRESHISGLIIPDLPLEEYNMILPYTNQYKIAIIPLIAPSTGLKRMADILKKTHGFVYAVTVNGTTGGRHEFPDEVLNRLKLLKENTDMPIVAGFGVSTINQVKTIGNYCDGVVVGSKIVDLAHNNQFNAIEQLLCGKKNRIVPYIPSF